MLSVLHFLLSRDAILPLSCLDVGPHRSSHGFYLVLAKEAYILLDIPRRTWPISQWVLRLVSLILSWSPLTHIFFLPALFFFLPLLGMIEILCNIGYIALLPHQSVRFIFLADNHECPHDHTRFLHFYLINQYFPDQCILIKSRVTSSKATMSTRSSSQALPSIPAV